MFHPPEVVESRIEQHRRELKAQRLARMAAEREAREAGTFWSAYGALTYENGRSRAVFCLRKTEWSDVAMKVFDKSHAGANAMVGPMNIVAEKGDAISHIIGGIVADEYVFKFA